LNKRIKVLIVERQKPHKKVEERRRSRSMAGIRSRSMAGIMSRNMTGIIKKPAWRPSLKNG
jgi:hypothetical protein